MKKKVGIMGGSFDPIHMSHLILAEAAYQELNLDIVRFLPSGNPPHKRNREGRASNEQRVKMVSLAIAGNPHFELSLEDMVEGEYSYTYRLLERFHAQNPDEEYYFIIGADSLFDFEKWKNPGRISELCTIVVATRNQTCPEDLNNQIASMEEKFSGRFIKLHTPELDISSNQLRKWVKQNKSIRYFVPEVVRNYIEDHKIYKDC